METNRRGFLKSLGALVVTGMLPKGVVSAVDFIEKKSIPKKDFGKFVNHMTIQRRTVSITGGPVDVKWINQPPVIGYYYAGIDDYEK